MLSNSKNTGISSSTTKTCNFQLLSRSAATSISTTSLTSNLAAHFAHIKFLRTLILKFLHLSFHFADNLAQFIICQNTSQYILAYDELCQIFQTFEHNLRQRFLMASYEVCSAQNASHFRSLKPSLMI